MSVLFNSTAQISQNITQHEQYRWSFLSSAFLETTLKICLIKNICWI